MTISILGCGWLGFPLAMRLVQEGHWVNGASRNPDKLAQLTEEKIQPFVIDLQPQISGKNLEAFFGVDCLIITIPPGRRRPDVLSFYPSAIENILQAALKFSCKQIIYTSSTGVYGGQTGIVHEQSPVAPNTPSSKAVVLAEEKILQRFKGQSTILRLAGLAGPDRHPGKWLAGKNNLPNGGAPVNLVHQLDVINAVVALLNSDYLHSIYNVCAAHHPSKSEYYAFAATSMDLEPPVFLKGGMDGKIVDSTLIRNALGVKFTYDDPYEFFNR